MNQAMIEQFGALPRWQRYLFASLMIVLTFAVAYEYGLRSSVERNDSLHNQLLALDHGQAKDCPAAPLKLGLRARAPPDPVVFLLAGVPQGMPDLMIAPKKTRKKTEPCSPTWQLSGQVRFAQVPDLLRSLSDVRLITLTLQSVAGRYPWLNLTMEVTFI